MATVFNNQRLFAQSTCERSPSFALGVQID